MPDGRIEPRQVERLREMGAWLKKYGAGVYGTRGGPFKPGKWGASTCKDNKIYLYVMNWPAAGPLVLPAVATTIRSVNGLSGGAATRQRTDKGIEIDVPAAQREPIATVIELVVDGRAFEVQYYDGQAWKTFYQGQTIGPEWSAQVEPVTAQRFRLNILKAPGGPTISEFALF